MSDCTTLNLLTKDGALTVTFGAKLTSEQYAQLFDFVRSSETKTEFKNLLATIAGQWGIWAVIDDPRT